MADQAPFPHFLPPSEHRLTTQASCRMLPQKPGTESACRNAREPLEHELPSDLVPPIATAQNKTERLWAERRTILPPSRTQGYAARDTYCFHHKKKGSSFTGTRLFFMVGMARFERAASASRTLRSSQTEPHPVAREDITPKACRMQAFFSKKFFSAMSGGIRSCPAESRTWRYVFCAYRAIRL